MRDNVYNDDLRIARLAAISLNGWDKIVAPEGIDLMSVCDRLWELAKNEEDVWRSQYLQSMTQFNLNWAKHAEEWFVAMSNAHTEELQRAWSTLIVKGHYLNAEDRNALQTLLLRILNAQDKIAKIIYLSAFQRLHEIIYETESVEFVEESLQLI